MRTAKPRFALRKGRFYVSRRLIDHDYDNVMKIMARCIVLDARQNDDGGITYTALSKQFDALAERDEPPRYSWHVLRDAGKKPQLVAVKA
jgi:hypothetical protein